MRTCRFCKADADESDLVKYEVRHYAHHKCYLDAGKKLSALHNWQVQNFPYRLLLDRGLLAEAAAIDQAHKEREAQRKAELAARAAVRTLTLPTHQTPLSQGYGVDWAISDGNAEFNVWKRT